MYPHIFKTFYLLLAIFSLTVNAETLSKQEVPEKVFNYIYKKHPEAKDIVIEEKTHFGQVLYKVTFTGNQIDSNGQIQPDKLVDLFKVNGHFYTSEYTIKPNAFNIISDEVKKSMQLRYPDYKIRTMTAVSNPNGVGDEYEIYLQASGKSWAISIDDKGELINETML